MITQPEQVDRLPGSIYHSVPFDGALEHDAREGGPAPDRLFYRTMEEIAQALERVRKEGCA